MIKWHKNQVSTNKYTFHEAKPLSKKYIENFSVSGRNDPFQYADVQLFMLKIVFLFVTGRNNPLRSADVQLFNVHARNRIPFSVTELGVTTPYEERLQTLKLLFCFPFQGWA